MRKKSLCAVVCSSPIHGNPRPWYFWWPCWKDKCEYLTSPMCDTVSLYKYNISFDSSLFDRVVGFHFCTGRWFSNCVHCLVYLNDKHKIMKCFFLILRPKKIQNLNRGLKYSESKQFSKHSTTSWGFGICQHDIHTVWNQNQVKDS